MSIVVDETHVGRRASGIERVTRALFSKSALAPLEVSAERSRRKRLGLVFQQTFALPAKAAARRGSVWIFPGFPPSPAFGLLRDRTVLYVHDVFLLTRRTDLNLAARYWLAPNFHLTLKRFKYFMANSETTAAALRPLVRQDARIILYRPGAENVFGLAPREPPPSEDDKPLVIGAIGTVEPRKNFPAAAEICERLARLTGRPVELHIIGRRGWGDDFDRLSRKVNVRLHGFLPDEAAREVIGRFDLLLCTSHDEGLCLPLLEAQFGRLQIAAPDQPIFREVLQRSGLFIEPADPEASAQAIAAHIAAPAWRERAAADSAANIERWNKAAAADRDAALAFLSELERRARR